LLQHCWSNTAKKLFTISLQHCTAIWNVATLQQCCSNVLYGQVRLAGTGCCE